MPQLKPGDTIFFQEAGDHHGRTAKVVQVNPKTIDVIEIKGSYRAGTKWRLQPNRIIALVTKDGQITDPETRRTKTGLRKETWYLLQNNGFIQRKRELNTATYTSS